MDVFGPYEPIIRACIIKTDFGCPSFCKFDHGSLSGFRKIVIVAKNTVATTETSMAPTLLLPLYTFHGFTQEIAPNKSQIKIAKAHSPIPISENPMVASTANS